MVVYPEKKPRACLFDLDNTLYDFFDAKVAACTSAVECIGCGEGIELFRYFLRNVHGFEDHANIEDFMCDRDVWHSETFEAACRQYDEVKLRSIRLFDGVDETLTLLREKGIKMAVVTDAGSGHAAERLERTGLAVYFDCVVTPEVSGTRKPGHDTFLYALRALDCSPDEVWVVGDSLRREIEPGNRLGMTTVYAEYGDWMKTPFPAIVPDFVLKRFSDLSGLMGL
jgi:putative hydrolase of the HAD superfamily